MYILRVKRKTVPFVYEITIRQFYASFHLTLDIQWNTANVNVIAHMFWLVTTFIGKQKQFSNEIILNKCKRNNVQNITSDSVSYYM